MKKFIIISLVLVIAVLGYLLFRSQSKHQRPTPARVISSTNGFTWYLGDQGNLTNPGRPVKITSTNANGESFTMFVGGVIVNGTNVAASNLDLRLEPAHAK